MEKKTQELETVLKSTHASNFKDYIKENKTSLNDDNSFGIYMKDIFAENHLSQQYVFLQADIPERYGYKLLSNQKHTKQRDVILRICYAGRLTLEQTQRALRKYNMPELYAKIERDALLMIIFNERVGNIIDVNDLLIRNGMEPLRTSGLQD